VANFRIVERGHLDVKLVCWGFIGRARPDLDPCTSIGNGHVQVFEVVEAGEHSAFEPGDLVLADRVPQFVPSVVGTDNKGAGTLFIVRDEYVCALLRRPAEGPEI